MRQFWRLTALPGAHSCIVGQLSAAQFFFSFIDPAADTRPFLRTPSTAPDANPWFAG